MGQLLGNLSNAIANSSFIRNFFTSPEVNKNLGIMYPNTTIGSGESSAAASQLGYTRANGNLQRYLQYKNSVGNDNGSTSVAPSTPTPASSMSSATAPASVGSVSAPSSATELERVWDHADLAKIYNMDNSVAYQEALSNTSYQRAVKDMQAAGLNPAALFGAGRVSGADGVTYVPQQYSYSGDSSGAYSSSKSYSSAKSSYAINNGVYNLVKLAGGALGLAATKGKYYGYMAGQSAATGVLRMINGFSQ